MLNKEIQKLTMTEDAEYTKKLSNTIKRIEDYNTGLRISCHPETVDIGGIINGLFGLSGKVGELTNTIQKWVFQGDSLDISYTQKKLGNILLYIDLISKSLGWSLNELMQKDFTDLREKQEDSEMLEFDDSQKEQKSSDLTFVSSKEYSEKVAKSLDELIQKNFPDLKKRQEDDETLEFNDLQEEQKSADLTFVSLKEYSEKVTKEAEERFGKSAMRDSVSYTCDTSMDN